MGHLRWEVLEHPSYSPDLSSCEYHIFGPLKKSLNGQLFSDESEVQAAVENWFQIQHRSFFTQGTHHIVDRWDTCSNIQGDFV
ncbi:uncharacterized protein TNCV_2264091 [Trichonephila clavipes]|nr:uncharacterized protein TNCV_2264091 [Trichonephila clavipes]